MTRQPLRRTFTLWLGGQNEAWVKVVDGKLIRHVENDGYAFMRHGPEADETEITLDDLMKEGRLSEAEIEALRAHLAGTAPRRCGSASRPCWTSTTSCAAALQRTRTASCELRLS